MCNKDNIERTIGLMQGMNPIEQEKLACVAQGMLLARTAAEEQANDLKYSAATDDQAS